MYGRCVMRLWRHVRTVSHWFEEGFIRRGDVSVARRVPAHWLDAGGLSRFLAVDLRPRAGFARRWCRPWWSALEREPRSNLDPPRRRRRRRLSEERRRQHAAEVQRVHVIQQVVRLRVELDAVAFGLAVDAADAAERIGVVAAHDAHLRPRWRRGRPAEPDAPAETQSEIDLSAPAAGIACDARRPIVADGVAVVVASGRDVVRQRPTARAPTCRAGSVDAAAGSRCS